MARSAPPLASPEPLGPGARRSIAAVLVALHAAGGWAWLSRPQPEARPEVAAIEATLVTSTAAPKATMPEPEPPLAVAPPPPPAPPAPAPTPTPPKPVLARPAPVQPRLKPAPAPAPVTSQASQARIDAPPPTPPEPARRPEPAPLEAAAPATPAAPAPVAAASVAPAAPAPSAAPAPAPEPSPPPTAPRTIAIGSVEYLSPPVLAYPIASRRARESGRVLVRVLVDPQGRPAQALVNRSSGFARLDDAALATVRATRFKPYTENGVASPFWVVMPLIFDLED